MRNKSFLSKKQLLNKKSDLSLSERSANVIQLQNMILDSFPEVWVNINGILKKLNGINVQMEKNSKEVKLKNNNNHTTTGLTAYYE